MRQVSDAVEYRHDLGVNTVRLAFAGSNDQPYRSVGGWLLQHGLGASPVPEVPKSELQN